MNSIFFFNFEESESQKPPLKFGSIKIHLTTLNLIKIKRN